MSATAGSRTVFISYHKRKETGGRVASFSLARGQVVDKCAEAHLLLAANPPPRLPRPPATGTRSLMRLSQRSLRAAVRLRPRFGGTRRTGSASWTRLTLRSPLRAGSQRCPLQRRSSPASLAGSSPRTNGTPCSCGQSRPPRRAATPRHRRSPFVCTTRSRSSSLRLTPGAPRSAPACGELSDWRFNMQIHLHLERCRHRLRKAHAISPAYHLNLPCRGSLRAGKTAWWPETPLGAS